jgi:protein-disulfide isomerase
MKRKLGLVAIFAIGAIAGIGGARLSTPALAKPATGVAPAKVAETAPAHAVDDARAVYRVPVDGSPVRGPADALVTIVEVMDFECPYCKRAEATVKQLEAAYPGKVRLVFKHNPIGGHLNAVPAAKLAEEARTQGGDARFWAAVDRLFELPALDRAALEAAGRELGLDPARLRAGLDGPHHVDRVRADQDLANALGARGTPTFFVNGRKLVGAQPLEAFRALVDEELAKAEALVREGVKPAAVYARLIEKGLTAAPAPAAIERAAAPAAAPATSAARVTVRSDDPVRGPALAPVTIVLFSDFQCPFCAKVLPTLKQLEAAYPKQVRIAWKHLPLPFHPNAMPAAKAAEAARAQGKFWEMHDRLFAGQRTLSDGEYRAAAKELGLDPARFERELAGEAAGKRIAEDQALAAASGASGTPTLFVNCRKVVGAQPLEAFRKVIDEELAKAKGAKVDAGFYGRACAANVAAAPPVAAAAPVKDVKIALRSDDPAVGRKDAKVTVVEFSDFQCPFCSRAVPAVKELQREFPGEVRVVWKHFPLPFHPNAMPAAIAAEAARQQGKFWEMHDRLFASQQALSDGAYAAAAKELGLDLGRFEAARKDPATRARVEEDTRAADAAGVNGTPTFVVDGEAVVGSAALKDAVRRHLGQARAKG